MALTSTQRLDEIETAITTILTTGQSYTTGDGRSLSRADLSALYAERRKIEGELAEETAGARRARVRFRH